MSSSANSVLVDWTHSPNDPHLTAEELTAIGQIVVIWGHIEGDLQHTIWEYIGDVEIGAVTTTGMMLEGKLRLLTSIAERKETVSKQLEVLLDILKRIDKLRTTRNEIVHGYWIDSVPQSYKKRLKEGLHPYDESLPTPKVDLLAFRDQSSKIAHDIWRFMGAKMILEFDHGDDQQEPR